MLSLSLSSQLHGVHFTFGLTWVCGRRLRPLSYFSKQHGVSAWASFVASLILFWTTRCECVDVFCGLVFFWTTLCECVDVFCGLSHFILNNTVWVCGRLLWPLSFYFLFWITRCGCVGIFGGLSHFILNNTVWVCGRFLWPLILFFILNNTVWVCGRLLWPLILF